jgi:hypothetical protein
MKRSIDRLQRMYRTARTITSASCSVLDWDKSWRIQELTRGRVPRERMTGHASSVHEGSTAI